MAMIRMESSVKAKRMSDFVVGSSRGANIKCWDGAARASYDWDGLRRDPDLWYRDGNCTVHLYEQGQSRRGPTFKIPFSGLLTSDCFPLVERFMARDTPGLPDFTSEIPLEALRFWSELNPSAPVELYIPTPPGSNKDAAARYHLATRNLLAWIFRHSVVGEHLGDALVGLLNTMREFRSAHAGNVDDLLSYCDEQGYLDFTGQPVHALAILRLAETFRLRDLYIDAFAHCVGMSDHLFLSPEYLNITSASRKRIREARDEMDLRLSHRGAMLHAFLEDELSEAHLGLAAGARAHLERFRSFLLSFYTTKFGYYPPSRGGPRSAMFEVKVHQAMAADFEALYSFLVDKRFTSKESSPLLAQGGGICVLQIVESFDSRHNLQTLDHPLPLLPKAEAVPASKRLSWIPSRSSKHRPDARLTTHAGMLRATNKADLGNLSNDLVRAYRKFEEDSVFMPLKADKLEKISHIDARKVRWILIYAVHQTLRSCTQVPPEVCDTADAPYHLSISTAELPVWKDEAVELEPAQNTKARTVSTFSQEIGTPSVHRTEPESASSIEIRPDIDYFAINHQQDQSGATRPTSRTVLSGRPPIPPRSQSLSQSFTRSISVRRPLSVFRSQPSIRLSQPPPSRPRRPSYQDLFAAAHDDTTSIVTREEQVPEDILLPAVGIVKTNRSASTSSSSSAASSTADSCAARSYTSGFSDPQSPLTDYSGPAEEEYFFENKAAAVARPQTPPPRCRHRPSVATLECVDEDGGDDVALTASPPPAIPARSAARRPFSVYMGSSPQMRDAELRPLPLRIRKDVLAAVREGGDGGGGGDDVFGACEPSRGEVVDVMSVWEQFADLGGLRSLDGLKMESIPELRADI